MCDMKDLSNGIERSQQEHYKLRLKPGVNSSYIFLTEILESGNINRREILNFGCVLNFTNIFIKSKSTIIFTDCLSYSYYSENYYEYTYNFLKNYELSKSENIFNHSHYLYIAKSISKQPFQSECYVCVKSYPKSSIMISLMLLMCGDTGTLINPGPIYRNTASQCDICESKIRGKSISYCNECKGAFHKKCINFKLFKYVSM